MLYYTGNVKLVNGSSPCSGRVELKQNGQWRRMSGFGWNMKAAAVVCKELGCGYALSAPAVAHFGEGSGRIVTHGVQCTGSESNLRDCHSHPSGNQSTPHDNDAGVICSGKYFCL